MSVLSTDKVRNALLFLPYLGTGHVFLHLVGPRIAGSSFLVSLFVVAALAPEKAIVSFISSDM